MVRSMVGRRRGYARVALSVAVAGTLAASCASGSSSSSGSGAEGADRKTNDTIAQDEGPAQDGGTLVVALASETSGWNNGIDRFAQTGSLVASSMLEPLAMVGRDGVAQPWLATEWKSNADYTEWTIKLRDGVTFHNGEAFDADAVKKNFDFIQTAPVSAVGVEGFFKTPAAEVVDKSTVKIMLAKPWAAFPSSFLAGQTTMMRAPAMLTAEDQGRFHPIGTGPFEFVSWTPDQKLQTQKFKNYWRKGEPHLDKLEFRVITDDSARAAALTANDVDMMLTVNVPDIDRLAGEYTSIHDWGSEPCMFVLNTRPKIKDADNPVANKHARKAMAYATDSNAIAALVGDGIQVPTGPFSPDSPWFDQKQADSYPKHDLAKAKEEIEAYKKDTGKPNLTVAVAAPSDVTTARVIQALQSQWQEAGIETTLESVETASLINRMIVGDFQVIKADIYSSPDPDQNWYFWSSTTNRPPGQVSINMAGFSTDTSQAALEKGRGSINPNDRKASYTDLISQLNDEQTNIYLYWNPYTFLANKKIHGLQTAAKVPFANFQPKTWWGEVWRTQ